MTSPGTDSDDSSNFSTTDRPGAGCRLLPPAGGLLVRALCAITVLTFLPSTLLASEGGRAATTDPVSQTIVGLVLASVFVLLALEAAHRVVVVLGAVGLLWLLTYFTPYHLMTFEGVAQALDFNVLALLASMMALVGVLKTTGAFEWMVAVVLRSAHGRPLLVLALVIFFTGVTSAFLDNVTTVVFLTPMVLGLARRMRMRPEAILLPMVMASNIGGTATLIGDPPNIMIGSGAGLTFLQFVEALTVPCTIMLFWLLFYSRRVFRQDLVENHEVVAEAGDVTVPTLRDPALARWMAAILGAVLLGFFTHHATGMPVAVPATIGAAAALIAQDRLYLRRHRPTHSERVHGVLDVTEKDIEWPTLAFFGFLFIIVGAAVATGLIGTIAQALDRGIEMGSEAMGLSPAATLLFAALVICWTAGILSAFIDNIPFVAVTIPVISQLAGGLQGDTLVLWWALSLGACLGGNGTIIGASANVTTIGLAERAGVRISFRQFSAFGAPVAIGTLLVSSIFLAAYIYLGRLGSTVAGTVILAAIMLGVAIFFRLQRGAVQAVGAKA